jgi:hypothetical protein
MQNPNRMIFCNRNNVYKYKIDYLSERHLSSSWESLSLTTQLNALGTKCKILHGEDIRRTVDDSGEFYHGSNYRNWIDYLYSTVSENNRLLTFDTKREMKTWADTIYNSFPIKLIELITNKNGEEGFKAFIRQITNPNECYLFFAVSTLSDFTYEFLGVHHNPYLWRSWLPSLIQTWESTETPFEMTMMKVWREKREKEERREKLVRLGFEDTNDDLRDTIRTLLEENRLLEFDREEALSYHIDSPEAFLSQSSKRDKTEEILRAIIENLTKANRLLEPSEEMDEAEIIEVNEERPEREEREEHESEIVESVAEVENETLRNTIQSLTELNRVQTSTDIILRPVIENLTEANRLLELIRRGDRHTILPTAEESWTIEGFNNRLFEYTQRQWSEDVTRYGETEARRRLSRRVEVETELYQRVRSEIGNPDRHTVLPTAEESWTREEFNNRMLSELPSYDSNDDLNNITDVELNEMMDDLGDDEGVRIRAANRRDQRDRRDHERDHEREDNDSNDGFSDDSTYVEERRAREELRLAREERFAREEIIAREERIARAQSEGISLEELIEREAREIRERVLARQHAATQIRYERNRFLYGEEEALRRLSGAAYDDSSDEEGVSLEEIRRRRQHNLEMIRELPTYNFEDADIYLGSGDDSDDDSGDGRTPQWIQDRIAISKRIRVEGRYLREWNKDVATYGEEESWRRLEKQVELETERIDRTGSTSNASKMWDKRTFLLKRLDKTDLRNTAGYDKLRNPNHGYLESNEISNTDITDECSICFDSNKRLLYKPECNHVFHWGCVSDWLDSLVRERNPLTCPMCRSIIRDRRLEIPNILPQQNLRVLSELPFYDFTEEENEELADYVYTDLWKEWVEWKDNRYLRIARLHDPLARTAYVANVRRYGMFEAHVRLVIEDEDLCESIRRLHERRQHETEDEREDEEFEEREERELEETRRRRQQNLELLSELPSYDFDEIDAQTAIRECEEEREEKRDESFKEYFTYCDCCDCCD